MDNRHNRMRPLALIATLLAGTPAAAQVCDGISVASSEALTTVRVAAGLLRPLLAAAPPGDVDRLFLVQQDGLIRILRGGALLATPFLDVAALTRSPGDAGGGNEEGLLGLAFHPGFAANGWFLIYHTDTTGANNLVVRYTVSANADVADAGSRAVVLTIPHPTNTNHDGGSLAFGPLDGMLYVASGDGGGSCDAPENAQNLGVLLGKMLRLDVDSLPYAVPPDNPFVGVIGALPEIWGFGLRNPWRCSFDALTGDYYMGDVGQFVLEEINYQPGTSAGGENYGWDRYEGNTCPVSLCPSSGSCALPGHVPPVVEYGHTGGACSVTGGEVYRGCRMPDLHGTYMYGDYCSAFLKTFVIAGGVATDARDRTTELTPAGGLTLDEITSFGLDGRGEIHVVDRGDFDANGGEVYKVVPILPNLEVSGPGAVPLRLTAAGPWTWEDLRRSSSHPLSGYRIYRSFGRGDGTFDCVQATAGPSWDTGDLLDPTVGELFSYLVTARNAAGQQTSPGTATDGTPRLLSAAACSP